LLKKLERKGAIITLDSMGSQKDIAGQIARVGIFKAQIICSSLEI